MRPALLLLFFALLQFSCGSSPQVSEKKYPKKLPDFAKCNDTPTVYDTVPIFNELKSLNGLGYSHTYNSINHRSDSLEREVIRTTNAKIAKVVVEKNIPNIKILNDSTLRNKSYSEIHQNAANIIWNLKDGGSERLMLPENFLQKKRSFEEMLRKTVPNLTVKNGTDKQLFIVMRSYIKGLGFKNYIHLFVFNKSTNRLLYYDEIVYRCDIRDQSAYSIILNYALEKLKAHTDPD